MKNIKFFDEIFDFMLEIKNLVLMLGIILHKKSLITIFGHKHEIKNFIKQFDVFHKKKFQQPSILVYIWKKIANFESKLH